MSIAILQRQYATFVAILIAVFATPALARSVSPDWYVCPLGGEKFSSMLSAEFYSEGRDELIVGPLAVRSMVQCPNGFLLAKPSYSDEEIARLAALIVKPAYVGLSERPTYQRLWWLRKELGADPFELAELRFLAEREMPIFKYDDTDGPAREYLQTLSSLPFQESRRFDWFRAYLRAVNILRERERFAEAQRLLTIISTDGLKPTDGKSLSEVRALSLLINERNSDRFPATLGTPEGVSYICLEPGRPLTESERVRCSSREVRVAMKQHCQKFVDRGNSQYAPDSCRQFSRINDIVSALAAALALLFLVLTFRGLSRFETHS